MKCERCLCDHDEQRRISNGLSEEIGAQRFELGRLRNLLDELRMDIMVAMSCLPPPRRMMVAEGQVVEFQGRDDDPSTARRALASAMRILDKERG